MKRLLITFQLLLLLVTPFQAGNINLEYQSGIGSYAMSDFRWISYEIENGSPLNLKKTSNFDPYFYWRPIVSYALGKNEFGFAYTLQSTGSRLSASDYSGTYTYDMRANASVIGFYYTLRMNDVGQFETRMYSNVGINISRISLQEKFELFETELYDFNIDLKGTNAYFEVGVKLIYPMKPCSLTVNIGYHYQPMGGQKMYEEDKNEPFEAMDSKFLYPDWTGIRFSVGISKSLKFLHF